MSPIDCDQEKEQAPHKLHPPQPTLERVARTKYLGAELTENLHWGKYIQSTAAKAY